MTEISFSLSVYCLINLLWINYNLGQWVDNVGGHFQLDLVIFVSNPERLEVFKNKLRILIYSGPFYFFSANFMWLSCSSNGLVRPQVLAYLYLSTWLTCEALTSYVLGADVERHGAALIMFSRLWCLRVARVIVVEGERPCTWALGLWLFAVLCLGEWMH